MVDCTDQNNTSQAYSENHSLTDNEMYTSDSEEKIDVNQYKMDYHNEYAESKTEGYWVNGH